MDLAHLNLPRELGQHLTGMDNMFFQLEHPRRLMTICSVWLFEECLDSTIIFEALENLCAHYPRFCLVPKHGTHFETPIWTRPYDDWTFKDNFIFHTLQEPSTDCLQKYMAQEYTKPFDFRKPLWQVHLITGLQGDRTAFLWKAHHSMSDGIGIMKAVLATTTSFDPVEATKQQVEQLQRRQSNSNNNNSEQQLYAYVQEQQQKDKRKKKDRQHPRTNYEKVLHKGMIFWYQVILWLIWGWQMLVMVTQQGYHELWTISLLVEPPIQQLRHLMMYPIRLLLSRRKPTRHLFYEDDQTIGKLIAWTDDMDLADIQKVQRTLGGDTKCTLNDVMLMVFVRSYRQYIQHHNKIKPSSNIQLRIIIPLSFRQPADYAMKNVVTGNMVGLNTGSAAADSTSTTSLLQQVHQRMMTVKRSVLPYAMYHVFIQTILRYCPFMMMPLSMQHWYTDLPHAIFTNILGPTSPTCFGGQEMAGFHVLPPQAGKGSISVGLVSYCDRVNISMLTDNHPEYPDLANVLCKVFISEFKSVLAEAGETLDNGNSGYGDSDTDSGTDVGDDDGGNVK